MDGLIAGSDKDQPSLGHDGARRSGCAEFFRQLYALQRGMASKSRHIAKHFMPGDLAGVQINRGQIAVRRLEQW